MVLNCIRCNSQEVFHSPNFSKSEKVELLYLKKQSPIYAVKYLIDKHKLTHRDSKFIVLHINLEYDKCNRCKVDYLEEGYVTCPKCKALNINWKNN